MAVIGLYGPLTLAISTISALLYGGAQILCGKYLGENTLKRAKSTFNIDIVAALCCGLVITAIFNVYETDTERLFKRCGSRREVTFG